MPQDTVVALDLQSVGKLPNELICSLLKRGAEGSSLSVTPAGFAALKALRFIDDSGNSQVPEKFRWKVTCEPIQESYSRQELSDSLVRKVAAELLKTSPSTEHLRTYHRQVELAKAAAHRDFSVEEVDGVVIVNLAASLKTEMARTTFIEFLTERLPKNKSCCLDLSVLGSQDRGLCNSLLALCGSRHRAGALPLDLVVSAELAQIFSAQLGSRLGFRVVVPGNGHRASANPL